MLICSVWCLSWGPIACIKDIVQNFIVYNWCMLRRPEYMVSVF